MMSKESRLFELGMREEEVEEGRLGGSGGGGVGEGGGMEEIGLVEGKDRMVTAKRNEL